MLRFILACLILLLPVTAVAKDVNWQLEMGGSALLGTSNLPDSIKGDDAALQYSMGYVASPQLVFGVGVTQLTNEDQYFALFGKGYLSSEQDSKFRVFARVNVGSLNPNGNSGFNVGVLTGVEMKISDTLGAIGNLANISSFTGENDWAKIQSAGVNAVLYFN